METMTRKELIESDPQANALCRAHIFEGMCKDMHLVMNARALAFGETYRVLEKKYGSQKAGDILLLLMDDKDVQKIVDDTKWYLSQIYGHDGFYDYKVLLAIGKEVTLYTIRTKLAA